MPTRTTSTKPAVKKPRAPRKTAVKSEALADHAKAEHHKKVEAVKPAEAKAEHKMPEGKYIFATGRRKTAVANVRLFSGKGEMIVNKKPLKEYFKFGFYQDEIVRPLELTGLKNDYYFTANVNGGGPHAQVQAIRHGVAIALGQISPEVRKVLKKNGFLTRDDRQKERKKPGLKRARRAPQWAKR